MMKQYLKYCECVRLYQEDESETRDFSIEIATIETMEGSLIKI